ncbi:protein-tyrosine phosphatase-like protein [Cytidiella melzeri]|nr:protein-tyrosine phosphatase-like protein [Cytidiella melzeri]
MESDLAEDENSVAGEQPKTVQVNAIRALLPLLIGGRHSAGASLILPRLYLSSYNIATKPSELDALGITHIVSVVDFVPEPCPSHIKRLHVKLNDTPAADILQHLEETTEFIRSALLQNESNKVLVHCLMGISRSATVVCAYLIATNQMTAHDALEFVKTKRSVVNPNHGFQRQLQIFASRCHSQTRTAVVVVAETSSAATETISTQVVINSDNLGEQERIKAVVDAPKVTVSSSQ